MPGLRLTPEQCIARAVEAVSHARRYSDDVEFSAEDATRTDLGFLCEVLEAVIAAGATTLNVPDTVGYAHPAQIQRMVETMYERVRGIHDVVVSVHCHDDLGLAVANTLAAVEAGVRQVECTINGIGERAGNAALEEIVMALRTRGDAFPYTTGVHTPELFRTSQLLSYITGIQPQPNKAIVGRNAFAHEAGIHQDGMLKERTTYEIMTPESVGVRETHLVLGKHSGRNALSRHYRALGFELFESMRERIVADVVKQSREVEPLQSGFVEVEFLGKTPGKSSHAFTMTAGVGIAGFDRRDESPHDANQECFTLFQECEVVRVRGQHRGDAGHRRTLWSRLREP